MTARPSRRRLLQLAGLSGTGVLLGGCSDGRPPATTKAGSTAPSTANAARLTFPARLKFGVATAAYQIEGATKADGRGPSIWDTFTAQPGKIDDGSTGEVACDHYHRMPEDLDLMKRLGVQSYRFSVAWPRVFPSGRGQLNAKGLDFYRRLVAGLRERGISPMATLFHWDLPQALQDEGGWQNRDCASWFAAYAAVVFDNLDGVDSWVTINEPKVVARQGYLTGTMAPGKKDSFAAGQVIHHLALGHGLAVAAFRSVGRAGRIGPCQALSTCYPADGSAEAAKQAEVADARENTTYLDPIFKGSYPASLDRLDQQVVAGIEGANKDGDLSAISAPVDFLGVNYYRPLFVDGRGRAKVHYPVASNGWEQIYPTGLYDLLRRISRDYRVSVCITENGIPDDHSEKPPADPTRISYLHDHLAAAHRAISEGVELESYHVWSLMDNFEWARGYTERWGLVRVNYDTQERVLKDSASWYAEVIAQHALPASR